jgi:hypothetical protein
MKKSSACLVLITSFFLNLHAQGTSENYNLLIEKYIKSISYIEKVKIVSDTLAKVFNGTFYNFSPGFSSGNGTITCSSYSIVIKDGKVTELEELSEDKKMNFLLSLVRADFYLKNEGDVKLFENSLDKIYPLKASDAKDKAHLKINKQWYFVRGDFFDSKKALIVTLDGNSKISGIDFSLNAIKK